MKKILAVVLLTLSPLVFAHGPNGNYRPYYHGPNHMWWVAPTVVGIVGYEIGRQQAQQPVIVQQPPVVVQQLPGQVYGTSPNCSPWTEVQNANGTITRTRTCAQ